MSLLRTSNLPNHDGPEHDLLDHGRFRHNLPEPAPKQVKKGRLHLTVTGTAVALATAIAGSLGAGSVIGAAQPAAIARSASVLSQPRQSGTGLTAAPAKPAVLDAFVATAGGRNGETPDTGAAGVTEGGKGIRLTPRQIARLLLYRFHWRRRQFRYLNLLWSRESSWNIHALNAYSGAYGIPQAVPGAKMASAGPRWRTSARTQILWGLRYIKGRYRSPEGAWNHELSVGWY